LKRLFAKGSCQLNLIGPVGNFGFSYKHLGFGLATFIKFLFARCYHSVAKKFTKLFVFISENYNIPSLLENFVKLNTFVSIYTMGSFKASKHITFIPHLNKLATTSNM